MSLNQSMNITLGSMKNNQYALTVVSQNIANMHVEGYHRQRVNFATNQYTTNCENVISTIKGMNGASITSLTDYIDDAAFKNLLDSNSDAQYYNTLADALGELEGLSDDLGDNGLNALLNDFFKASADLEQFPTDMTIRRQYVQAAQTVCDKFNEISSKCDTIQDDKFHTIGINTQTINGLLSDLALANQNHIKNHESTATQVEIQGILEELSNYMDITTTENANGSINVLVAGIEVVRGGEQKYSLQSEFNPDDIDNAVKFSLKSLENPDYVIENGVNDAFKSGSLKAQIDFLNGKDKEFTNVNDIKSAIDIAANTFAQALNNIQTYDNGDVFAASLTSLPDGTLALEKATEPMFTTIDGSTTINASNIQVNLNIMEDPFKVSAARIDLNNYEATDDWTKSVGNSDNAVEITALQHAKICSYNGGNNNCTLSQYLINNATKTGADVASIESKAQTAQDLADADATNYSNLVGVNLDEELADMIKYQRSFEASAKVFSTVNDLMGTIISMV